MKKVLSILCIVFLFFSISGIHANENDSQNLDPWLGVFHDSLNSGYSNSIAQPPLKEAWVFESDYGQRSSLSGSSVIYNGILYTQFMTNIQGRTSEIIAVDMENGEEIWRTEIEGRLVRGCPVISTDNEMIYTASTDGYASRSSSKGNSLINAIYLEDGEINWTTKIDGAIFSSIFYGDGGLYVNPLFVQEVIGKDW